MTGLDVQAVDRVLRGGDEPDRTGDALRGPRAALEEFFANLERKENQGFALAISQAVRASPELAAEAQRLAGETGVPDVLTIERNIDRFRALVTRQHAERLRLARGNSALVTMLTDPSFARIAHDDLDALGELDRVGEAFDIGKFEAELNQLDTKRRDVGLSSADLKRYDEVSRYLEGAHLPSGWLRTPAKFIGQMAMGLPRAIEVGAASGLTLGAYGAAAGPVAPFTAAGGAAGGFIIGSGAELWRQSWVQEGGNLYRDMLAQGIDERTAAWVSRIGGAVAATVETAGAGIAARAAGLLSKPVRQTFFKQIGQETTKALARPTTRQIALQAAKGYLEGGLGEIGTEAIQEAVAIVSEDAARVVDGRPSQLTTTEGLSAAAARVGSVVAETARAMALLGIPGPAANFAVQVALRKSEASHEAVQEVADKLDATKLLKRSPEGAERLVGRILANTPDETTYIRADRFAEALAQTGRSREDLAESFPGIAEQLDAALATGGDVVIPTATWLARIRPEPLGQSLAEHVRYDPDGYSAAELPDVEAAQKELAAQASQAVEAAATFAQSGRAVEEAFRQQLEATGRVQKRVARDTAAAWRAFIETQAADIGVTPEHLARQLGIRVVRGEGEPAAQAVAQRRVAAFEPDTGEIALFGKADVTSVLHEMAHAFLHLSTQLAVREGSPARLTANVESFLRWRGLEGGAKAWSAMSREEQRAHHEAFAESFERYAFEGVAPSLELQRVFANFRRWIARLWRNLTGQIQEVPAEVRAVFDRMLASDDAIAHAEAVRGLVPMFHVKPEAWTEAAWERYQQHLDDATEAAVAEVQRRSLRDMQWLSRAGGRKVRELQRQHDEIREEIRKEIRAEVEAEPVYRALDFVRKGRLVDETGVEVPFDGPHKLHTASVRELIDPPARKPRSVADMELTDAIAALGGLNRKQALAIGVDPAEINERRNVRGKLAYVFPKKGRSLDEIREALEQEGFRFEDEDALATQILNSMLGESILSERKEFSEGEVGEAAERFAATRPDEPARRRVDLRALNITSPEGVAPDDVAALFGFRTGENLVRAIIEAPPIDEVVEQRTEQHMTAQYSDLRDAKAVQRAVDEALHNPARARFVATELRALEGANRPTRLMVAAARELARAALQGLPVAQIKAWRFQAAEGRARREALRAAGKGETAVAIEAVRTELLQHEMAREAALIEQEVAIAEGQFRRFYKPDEKLARTRDVDIVALGRAALDARAGQAVEPLRMLLDNERFGPETKEELAEIVARITENRTPLRQLPLGEWRTFVEGLDALWERALREQQIRVEGRLHERRRIVDILLSALQPPDRPPRPTRAAGGGERARQSFGSLMAAIRHAESWALEQDGSTTGPVHRYLFALLREPFDSYLLEKRALVHDVSQRLRALRIERNQKIEANEINYVFSGKRELIGTLLHMGNPGNLRRLLLGMEWIAQPAERGGPIDESPWWRFVDRAIAEGLITKADMDFVQGVWDTFESLFPRSQDVHMDVYGYRAEQVEPRAIETPWGTYRGGYFRLQVDRAEAQRRGIAVPPLADDAVIETSRETRAGVPTTGRGFMISRVEINYPPIRDVRLVASAVDEELRFIHLQSPGRDVLRLLRDPRLSAAINAIDPHAINGIWLPWLRDTLQNRVMKSSGHPVVDSLLSALRRNTGLALMFANLRVALQQVTGLANARAHVPLGQLRNGFFQWSRSPRETWRRVTEASAFMRSRLEDAAGQITDDVELLGGPAWLRAGQDWTRKHGHFLQRWFQIPVDIITWIGAHEDAVAQGRTPEEAIRHADAIVRRTQSSGLAPDISRYERSSAPVRLITQFSTYWLASLNLLIERPSPQRIALIVGLVGLTSGAITKALEGGWDDDDQDGEMWDDVASWTFAETFKTGTALLPAPVGRILAPGPGGRVSFGAALGQVDRARRGIVTLFEAPFTGEQITGSDIRDVGTALTLLLGVPATPITRAAGFARDVQIGREPEPENVAGRISGLIVGR